jgi:hypothetical protein
MLWLSSRFLQGTCISIIVGLLACSKWDDGTHLANCQVFDRLDEPSPDLVDLVNVGASWHVSVQRMLLMSHLCFVCAPHVPAW